MSADVLLLEELPGGPIETIAAESQPSLRPGLRTVRNVDHFEPVKAKFVRFTVLGTSDAEPCLDELEVYSSGDALVTLRLASERCEGDGIRDAERLRDPQAPARQRRPLRQ